MRRTLALTVAVAALLAVAPAAAAQEPIHYCKRITGDGWPVWNLSGPRSMKCGSIRKVAKRWVNASWCDLGDLDCRFRVPADTGHRWSCGSQRLRGRWYQYCGYRDRNVTFNYRERRSAAAAQVDRHCKSVTAGGWKATNIGAFQIGCKSVRDKLKRWLPRAHLPRNRDGWFCTPIAGGRVNRQCTHFNRQTSVAVGFVFRRQRR